MSGEERGRASVAGEVLDGRYRMAHQLGEGGMGTVYLATDQRLEKRVAVKVMSQELAANQDALERFRREARITSGLGHPHIVQVFDFGTTPTGAPYLVMELLEGEDLDHRLRRVGRLSAPEVARIVKQVASALAAAHAQDIVHRDLKPANIYLLHAVGETDFVKVLDFGISKVRTASSKLTRDSAIVGTPNYMSPEQAEGKIEDVDAHTDQWALACIACECLSGEMLFSADDSMSVLYKVVHTAPSMALAESPRLPPTAREVLLRALAKDKRQRFERVDDLATALEAAVAGEPASVAPTVPRTVELQRTVELTPTILDEEPARPSGPATTLTKTVGEMQPLPRVQAPRPRTWMWPVAVGAAVALLLIGLLFLRPQSPSQPIPASRPSELRPSPAAEPPPLALPPAAPSKNESTPVPPAEQRKAAPDATSAKQLPLRAGRHSAKKRQPSQHDKDRDQDQWRLY